MLGRKLEPAMPRRKKHPELAYKTHTEFLSYDEDGSNDSIDASVRADRARVFITNFIINRQKFASCIYKKKTASEDEGFFTLEIYQRQILYIDFFRILI